jgi:hypothetical protein
VHEALSERVLHNGIAKVAGCLDVGPHLACRAANTTLLVSFSVCGASMFSVCDATIPTDPRRV